MVQTGGHIEVRGARPCILLVEDEKSLAALIERYLVRCGYLVASGETAAEGWAKFQEWGAECALAIVDLTLPDMPGEEIARRMLASNPSLRVILSSGSPGVGDLGKRCTFLQKPFLPKALVDAVEAALKPSGHAATDV